MKKKFSVFAVCLALLCSATACGGENKDPESSGETPKATYQSIYEKYRQEMEYAIPGLVEDFRERISGKEDDVEGILEIAAEETEKLSETAAEGVQEMSQLPDVNPDESGEDEFEEWSEELHNAFEGYSEKLNSQMAKAHEKAILDSHDDENPTE